MYQFGKICYKVPNIYVYHITAWIQCHWLKNNQNHQALHNISYNSFVPSLLFLTHDIILRIQLASDFYSLFQS
jgi:hypothetical protein